MRFIFAAITIGVYSSGFEYIPREPCPSIKLRTRTPVLSSKPCNQETGAPKKDSSGHSVDESQAILTKLDVDLNLLFCRADM